MGGVPPDELVQPHVIVEEVGVSAEEPVTETEGGEMYEATVVVEARVVEEG